MTRTKKLFVTAAFVVATAAGAATPAMADSHASGGDTTTQDSHASVVTPQDSHAS